jgi:hypothetical protein
MLEPWIVIVLLGAGTLGWIAADHIDPKKLARRASRSPNKPEKSPKRPL